MRRNGLFIGAFAPYGYQKAEDNKNHLVPDPYAAGVVQGIFAKKLSGMSASGIARILKNVVYIGTLAQGKRTTVSHKVKKEIAVPECD